MTAVTVVTVRRTTPANTVTAVTTDTHCFSGPFTAEEILSSLIDDGMLDADGVQKAMNKKKYNYVQKNHSHSIWEGEDGRWRTYLPDADKPKGRKLVSRGSQDELVTLLFEFYTEAEKLRAKQQITLEELLPEWQEYKSLYVTDATIKRDKTTWKSMYEGEPITKQPIRTLTKADIEEWILKKVRLNNMNSHQYNNFSLVIRQMLTFAVEREIIDSNPFDRIRIPKNRVLKPEVKKPSETEVFYPDERDALIQYAFKQYEGKRDRVQIFIPLAIAFLLYVGLRRGEITALRFDDIVGKQIILHDSYSHDMKCLKGRLKDSEGWRTVSVVPAALDIIEMVRKERERLDMPTDKFIFCVDEGFESFYSGLGKMINNYCEELGIPQRSIHKTRKTVASVLHVNGVDDLIIQKEFGHKDLRTTQQCYCYDLTTDDERYEKIAKSLS